ncbi:putative oxidoreductase [Paenimyroides ummariense]|uniref:Putative oxidoreductase n=1 Tax=Paenimyroides ummariense TaxID=913024 RepID=A0A1I5EKZ2_9FLAO|nr:DoxX family protein [Paenimyroides ummariense]SFO12177.1 putative oxidoreductase [Paenimyroides ummariense]
MKLSTTKISPKTLSFGLLLFRLCLGGLMIANHGWIKIVNLEVLKTQFYDFLGLGSQISLILAITVEILCSILLIFGLYTRVALIPLIVTMLVAIGTHGWQIFGDAELGFLYLIGFVFLLIVGPGDNSIDARMNKRTYF